MSFIQKEADVAGEMLPCLFYISLNINSFSSFQRNNEWKQTFDFPQTLPSVQITLTPRQKKS